MQGFAEMSMMAKEQLEFDEMIAQAKLQASGVRKFRDTKPKVDKEKKKAKKKQAKKSRKTNRGK